jgi:type II secretory pathway component GspD/PulD (secretin)
MQNKSKITGSLLASCVLLAVSCRIAYGRESPGAGEASGTSGNETARMASPVVSVVPSGNAGEAASELVSLDLKNVETVELFRLLSLKTGKTIVPSKSVAGRITIFLNNVRFDEVLDIILLGQRLAYEKKGNALFIMTNDEYKQLYGRDYQEPRTIKTVHLSYAKPSQAFAALSSFKSDIGKIVVDEASGTVIMIDTPKALGQMLSTIEEIDVPLTTRVFDLNYIKPADAKSQLTAAITPGTGQLIIDERSGKAIVSDLPWKMEQIASIVHELDEESRQVFIDCDIVQVNLSSTAARGIEWQKVFSSVNGLAFNGSFPVSATLSSYQKISVGTLATDNYTAVLNFIETYGKTETLSHPKIAVVNKEDASILVGTRDAYITQTASQSTSTTVTSESVQFIDVGVKLKITPTIGKDGFITMKIQPEVSSVKETITTSLGSRIPIVQTSQTSTVVKVKDGTTIMMAGLQEYKKIDSSQGVPGFFNMPIVKYLFGNRDRERTKTELIIFITPHLFRGESFDSAGAGQPSGQPPAQSEAPGRPSGQAKNAPTPRAEAITSYLDEQETSAARGKQ